MKHWQASVAALGAWVCALVPAGSAVGAAESILYRFKGGSDGAGPMAAMVADKAGNLYGTTGNGGGASGCADGCGTVFELSPPTEPGGAWSETVIYSFQGGSDGAIPLGALLPDQSGNLYGTTSQGGGGNCGNEDLSGCGTVFELTLPARSGAAWTETLLYSFRGNPRGKGDGDLAWPNGLVFDAAGNLMGLAYDGGHCSTDETGTYCNGGAFRLKQSGGAWKEQVVYRFRDPSGAPAGPVMDPAGNVYGTAPGGAHGCGGVFRLTPSGKDGPWTESSIYDFQCGSDGAFPLPGLILDSSGNLYDMSLGTASGYGNIFELAPVQGGGWAQSVLYNFARIRRGYTPSVGPILGNDGRLYGTTEEGGASDRGAVLELAPPAPHHHNWKESVLHSFSGGSKGFAPEGGLNFGAKGALYGTTQVGGDLDCGGGNGCGTVFRVVP